MGVGIHGPDAAALTRIRARIVEHPEEWRAAVGEGFQSEFRFEGESLKRPPKGFEPDHPLIEDLKRKEHIGILDLSDEEVSADGFTARFHGICMDGMPLIRFLCEALELPL